MSTIFGARATHTSKRSSISSNPGGMIGLLMDFGRDSKKSGMNGKCLLRLIPIMSS